MTVRLGALDEPNDSNHWEMARMGALTLCGVGPVFASAGGNDASGAAAAMAPLGAAGCAKLSIPSKTPTEQRTTVIATRVLRMPDNLEAGFFFTMA